MSNTWGLSLKTTEGTRAEDISAPHTQINSSIASLESCCSSSSSLLSLLLPLPGFLTDGNSIDAVLYTLILAVQKLISRVEYVQCFSNLPGEAVLILLDNPVVVCSDQHVQPSSALLYGTSCLRFLHPVCDLYFSHSDSYSSHRCRCILCFYSHLPSGWYKGR